MGEKLVFTIEVDPEVLAKQSLGEVKDGIDFELESLRQQMEEALL